MIDVDKELETFFSLLSDDRGNERGEKSVGSLKSTSATAVAESAKMRPRRNPVKPQVPADRQPMVDRRSHLAGYPAPAPYIPRYRRKRSGSSAARWTLMALVPVLALLVAANSGPFSQYGSRIKANFTSLLSAGGGDTSSLTVDTVPAGAIVYLDGKPSGLTPYSRRKLTSGRHTIKVDMAGYSPQISSLVLDGKMYLRFQLVHLDSVGAGVFADSVAISNSVRATGADTMSNAATPVAATGATRTAVDVLQRSVPPSIPVDAGDVPAMSASVKPGMPSSRNASASSTSKPAKNKPTNAGRQFDRESYYDSGDTDASEAPAKYTSLPATELLRKFRNRQASPTPRPLSDSLATLVQEGDRLFAEGRYQAATEVFEQVARVRPDNRGVANKLERSRSVAAIDELPSSVFGGEHSNGD